jgi:hypothetical protein
LAARYHAISEWDHSSMTDAMKEYGRADFIQQQLGLSLSIGQKLAAIITFAGSIEYHLERALWRLRRIDPKNVKPETDARVITDLISMLERFAASLAPGEEKALLEGWCQSATPHFGPRRRCAISQTPLTASSLAYSLQSLARQQRDAGRWHFR